LLFEPGLLQHTVGRVPGLDFVIDWKVSICFWAAPDVMVTVPMTDKVAVSRP
jgi:hypothetical protein